MSALPQTRANTRAVARVIGPFLVIVPGIVTVQLAEVAPARPGAVRPAAHV